nr:YdeI/OmpD-associated family protein [Bacillota bacterium]
MKNDMRELTFLSRADFRAWLAENAETGEGAWLVFGKTKALPTLKAGEALEEALCFGWIDGQMKSVDETKYVKYFAKRRAKSVWSVKNKKLAEALREKGMMTELGEQAIETAKSNGMWDERTEEGEQEMVAAFAEKLRAHPRARENFMKMPPSAKLATARWYHSPKSEELRQREFPKIVEALENGWKPGM